MFKYDPNGAVAQSTNGAIAATPMAHRRVGHLLQGRFKSIVVDPLGWGLELSRYVHLNPVRIGRLGLDKIGRQKIRAASGRTI